MPFALPSWFAWKKKPMGISEVWIRPDVRNPWKRLQSTEQQVRIWVSKFTPWHDIHPKQISENSYERLTNKFAVPVPRGISEQMNCLTEMAEHQTQLLCISSTFSVRDTATKCAADLGTTPLPRHLSAESCCSSGTDRQDDTEGLADSSAKSKLPWWSLSGSWSPIVPLHRRRDLSCQSLLAGTVSGDCQLIPNHSVSSVYRENHSLVA
jgi:hypothetical protein